VGFPQSPVENVDNFLVGCGYVIEFSTGGVENMDPKEPLEKVFAGNPEVRKQTGFRDVV